MSDENADWESLDFEELLGILQRQLLRKNQQQGLPESLRYFCNPASDASITAMQSRLNEGRFPRQVSDEYLKLLRCSDGFYPHEGKEKEEEEDGSVDLTGYLYRARHVEREDFSIDLQLFEANPLVHPLPDQLNLRFNWPRISGIDIGSAGDEGHLWLIGPEDLRACKDEFERVYAELESRDKHTIDALVSRLYGGDTSKVMEQEWTVLEFYHWSPVLKLHLSIRDYLISAIHSVSSNESDALS